jgi:hypothetical protein
MGSGETAPTMVKVHRAVRDRLGAEAAGVLLDTPYGFQRNADDLSARAVAYFRDSVGMTITPADFRTSADLDGQKGAAITARMAAAPLLFSGPGSPSYALRQWAGTLVPGLLAEKLALGGAVTFASAAALTLGALTVPVYEIYKVGEAPRWLEGLDLLSKVGIPAVVIPHYDNAEGGTHDTRFCYLGEERLELLEAEIPDGVFVLGVDEHTAITFDLDSGEATIAGNGRVTVRVKGSSSVLEAGQVMSTAQLLDLATSLASGTRERSGEVAAAGAAGAPGASGDAASGDERDGAYATRSRSAGPDVSGTPLLQAVRKHEAAFRDAKTAGDAAGMVGAALDLNDELWSWVADPNQSDELDRGRAALRSMLAELGELAAEAMKDPAELFGPFVDLLVQNRNLARAEKRFADADAVRDGLASLGIEIHDTPEGSTWERP